MHWHSPEELVEIGFAHSRVVMMNEAHNGLERCIRTREVGWRILPTAHAAGVRHLAMEALWSPEIAAQANESRQLPEAEQSYLSQPEMRAFIHTALDLGWTLVPYEADLNALLREKFDMQVNFDAEIDEATRQKLESIREYTTSLEVTNWREEQQARNLIAALDVLPPDTRLLVWCGNGHLQKVAPESTGWIPMAQRFQAISGIDPFTIDQTLTVEFPGREATAYALILETIQAELAEFGGTAGIMTEDADGIFAQMASRVGADALIISRDNRLD